LTGLVLRPFQQSWESAYFPRLDAAAERWLALLRLEALKRSWAGIPILSQLMQLLAVPAGLIRQFLKDLLEKAADTTWMASLPKRHWAEEERKGLLNSLGQVYDRLRCLLEKWPSAIQDQDKRVEKALDKELPDLIAECKKRQSFDLRWLED